MTTDEVMEIFKAAWQVCSRFDDDTDLYDTYCLHDELEKEFRKRLQRREDEENQDA